MHWQTRNILPNGFTLAAQGDTAGGRGKTALLGERGIAVTTRRTVGMTWEALPECAAAGIMAAVGWW